MAATGSADDDAPHRTIRANTRPLRTRPSSMHDSSIAAAKPLLSVQRLRPMCEGALTQLCGRHPEISLVLVATADARLVSSRVADGLDAHRVAAMSAALLALGETLAQELSGGGCQSALLSMDSYTCAVVHIPDLRQSLLLAVGVRQNILPALARRLALDLAEKLSQSLGRPEHGATAP